MFSWVCPRCGHEVPPSKTECPFCTPPAPEPVAPQVSYAPPPPQQQYQAPQPPYAPPAPQQAPPQQAPPQQYAQQAPPQYWQPLGPPPPQQQYPPQYAQQAPPQYWQPQQYPPQQYPPQQYQPVQEQPPQQYQPPPPPPPPQEPPPQQYQPPPPPQYSPAPPQYTPPAPPVEYKQAEYRQPEPVQNAPTPWPPEEQAGKPAWLVGVLAFVGVLVLLGIVYYVVGSHSSSSAKDAAKQQTTNPLQKYVEVVGIRIVSEKGGEAVKFLVVNHEGTELTDLTANVTLWASTQRSEEDSVGTFTFHVDSLGPNEAKELSAPLKTDKGPADMPDDWRNITADVQVAAAQ